MKNYRVIITTEINVKANSKEEVEKSAKDQFSIRDIVGKAIINILQFNAILDDIQDNTLKEKNYEEPNTNEC